MTAAAPPPAARCGGRWRKENSASPKCLRAHRVYGPATIDSCTSGLDALPSHRARNESAPGCEQAAEDGVTGDGPATMKEVRGDGATWARLMFAANLTMKGT